MKRSQMQFETPNEPLFSGVLSLHQKTQIAIWRAFPATFRLNAAPVLAFFAFALARVG